MSGDGLCHAPFFPALVGTLHTCGARPSVGGPRLMEEERGSAMAMRRGGDAALPPAFVTW